MTCGVKSMYKLRSETDGYAGFGENVEEDGESKQCAIVRRDDGDVCRKASDHG